MAMHNNELTITRPDDWHLHLRAGPGLFSVLPDTVRRFGRALVMPNLKPPVTTTKLAEGYRATIFDALAHAKRQKLVRDDATFEPLMTLYLTDKTTPEEIRLAKESGFIHAVKYYPAGATTNSDSGVTDIHKLSAVLETMEEVGMPLCMHGEVTDPAVDIFDREKRFIDKVFRKLFWRYSKLKFVLEHMTTRDAIEFVKTAGIRVAGTITVHHLRMNRNALFQGGLRPHNYCLPVAKRERHRLALLEAATSGNPQFFLGTDSAPHARNTKEAACGCAGCYTAHGAIELCAETFEAEGKLAQLEPFTSHFGAGFYGLPRNKDTLTLIRKDWVIPEELPFGDDTVAPFRNGQTVSWQIAD